MRLSSTTLALATAGALAAASSAAAQQRDTAAPPAATSLIGRVVDDRRCTPMGGVAVVIDGTPLGDTTGADGRFDFRDLPASTYTVIARRSGYSPDSARDVAVRAGELGYAELRVRAVASGNGGDEARADSAGLPSAHSDSAPTVTTVPARPTQGSLVRLRVTWPGGSAAAERERLSGTLGGQRLHFRRVGAGAFEALAPIPVNASDTLPLVVELGRETRRTLPLRVARADFPVERLRVAPEFGRRPDLALAERLERESEKARDVGCQAHLTPRLWSRPFVRPRPGRVTSTFGRAREYNGTVTSRHTGTDFAGATGAPIRATNRGVVRLVDRFYLGGNVVYVDHGEGLVSAYLHLSRTDVAVGDTVARGQVIGGVGSTGRVTGPHLHWVVRYGTVSVDPMSLLAIAGEPPPAPPRPAAPPASR